MALNIHKSVLLQGAVPGVTGQVLWCGTGTKIRGHKGEYVQDIRGKFRDSEREVGIAMPLHSPCSWGKTGITADCPSLWSASTMGYTSENPLYAVQCALWWSLSSLSHWTKFLWQVHETTSLLWAHSALGQGVPVVFFLCTEKWILPAEVSSLEKDGFSNSSFSAISATHTNGVAQPSRHRLGSCTEITAIG